jgi:polar amino acid transport system substrate-binding protein
MSGKKMEKAVPPTLLRVFLVLTASVFLASCWFEDTTLERVQREGVIRLGYANDIPFGYSTPAGKLTGEAPEVASEILSSMGIHRVEGFFTEFASLIPDLKAGRFDMIAAGMFVLPKRCEEISFSEPTYKIGQAFLVKAGNPKGLHGYEDIAGDPDAKLAIMEGAAERGYALATGVSESQIVTVPDTPSGVSAVREQRADALALTSLSIGNLVRSANDPGLERAHPFRNPVIGGRSVFGYGAFGFRKKDRDLLEAFNKHLTAFLGTEQHMEMVKPFGFTEFPQGVTTAELCRNPE